MAVQVAFLITAALLTMAAVYPYDSQAKAELECDEDSMRRITFGSVNYNLRLCRETNTNIQCVDGLPERRCGATASHCQTVSWNQGSLQASICGVLFSSGQCYMPASQNSEILPSCNDIPTVPTVPPVVPPLTVSFIGDSPRVQGDSVEADILLSRPVQSLICRLKGGSLNTKQDCSGGHVVFSGLSPAVYTLRVVARDEHNNKAIKKTRFEVTDDPERCTLHLINEGVSVSGDSARVEFVGRGPANGYLCHLDSTEPYQCSSPVMLSGLSQGKHILRVEPTGCGTNRKNLQITFIIE